MAKDAEIWKEARWEWHDINEHWNYETDEIISVELYSNCEEIELFLNERSMGKRKLSEFEDHIYKWGVPFEAGELKAVGFKNGRKHIVSINTAQKPTKLILSVDKTSLNPDGYDVAHIIAQVVDENNFPVKHEDRKVQFDINGKIKMLGIDNGSIHNTQKHQYNEIITNKGRALIIVQSMHESGEAIITVSSEGIESSSVNLKMKK